ncbi:MAG: hypothetical protein D6760_00420 [Deltaproteobacteria bacterium]|nr:MAG: hypothetical protein D6760_00420 [Deltaproteobacteria bacterium]
MAEVNAARYRPGERGGFYESYFLRANHPTEPRAFWIRYTLMSPKGRPEDAIGELWAVWFDGAGGTHVAAKNEVPAGRFSFARDRFDVVVGDARLGPGRASGSAASKDHVVSWELEFGGRERPLLLLARGLYERPWPKAKALVGLPHARFSGWVLVDGERYEVRDWVGSQNHNWGNRHTDFYAWGQVAGFDGAGDAFLEVASGRLKVGPLWTPMMTLVVLRTAEGEWRCDSVRGALRAKARVRYFDWSFEARAGDVRLRGRISAERGDFVGLRYFNPPGGVKHCLNSKIADCRLEVTGGGGSRILECRQRAAFEILTDRRDHGIPLLV